MLYIIINQRFIKRQPVLKKYLLLLIILVAAISSCRKDIGTDVTISSGDLANINGQLKGNWVFPLTTLTVVDKTGKVLQPATNDPASAYEFDGSKVTVRPDPQTAIQGTYKLESKNGVVAIDIVYSDGTKDTLSVEALTDQGLTLTSEKDYTFYDGTTLTQQTADRVTTLKKQSSADATGNFMNVVVTVPTQYSVSVYVTHQRGIVGETAQLVGSKENTTGTYTLNLLALSGDLLKIDVLGDPNKTSINAYFKGIPISGQFYKTANETITTTGWTVKF